MGFFNNLKDILNNVEKVADNVKNFQEKIENEINGKRIVEENTGNNQIISNMSYNSNSNLSNENYSFEFDGTNYKYTKSNPTNFYISNENFGAIEVCNVYFYSKNGEEIEDVWDIDLKNCTIITFSEWNFDPVNNKEKMKNLLSNYGLTNPNVEIINMGNILYRVKAESNDKYYDSYFLKADGRYDDETKTHKNLLQIELRINKRKLNMSEIQEVLNEYHSIIDTLEIK